MFLLYKLAFKKKFQEKEVLQIEIAIINLLLKQDFIFIF